MIHVVIVYDRQLLSIWAFLSINTENRVTPYSRTVLYMVLYYVQTLNIFQIHDYAYF